MKQAYESRLAPDIYEEYMVINGAWEIIGNTKVDLSDYATEQWVQEGYQPKGDYLTSSDLADYVTDAELTAKGYLTEH